MMPQATERRGAQPLVLLACALLALCTASCAVLYGGRPGQNPWNLQTRQQAQHMHSIEEFQRDIEPTIIDARNEFINGSNILAYSSRDHIHDGDYEGTTLYILGSAQYFFEERDVDKVRSILNDSLTPLGFTMWEKRTMEIAAERQRWSGITKNTGRPSASLLPPMTATARSTTGRKI